MTVRIVQSSCSASENFDGYPAGSRFEVLEPSYGSADEPWEALGGRTTQWTPVPGQPPLTGWRWLGVGFFLATYIQLSGQVEQYTFFLIPDWCLTLVLALLPVLGLMPSLRNRRRRSRGVCANCGYDLRATPDRCPECGTIAAPPAV